MAMVTHTVRRERRAVTILGLLSAKSLIDDLTTYAFHAPVNWFAHPSRPSQKSSDGPAEARTTAKMLLLTGPEALDRPLQSSRAIDRDPDQQARRSNPIPRPCASHGGPRFQAPVKRTSKEACTVLTVFDAR